MLLAATEPFCFYFESCGILYTNATFAGVVLAVVPVVSILLAAVFLREFPSRRQVLFCLLPIAGVVFLREPLTALSLVGSALIIIGVRQVTKS